MVGLVCRVGQAEANIREAGKERVHVEIQEVGDEGLESSVEVDGIIERKHFFRVEVSVNVFKHGTEKVSQDFDKSNYSCNLRFLLQCSVRRFLLHMHIDAEQCLR